MKVIVAIDKRNGVMFANRRQSQDIMLREYILELTKGNLLYMSNYSVKQFEGHLADNIIVCEDLQSIREKECFVFVESQNLKSLESDIKTIYICKWNRDYPSSQKLDVDYKKDRKLVSSKDIVGKSHKKITIEEWSKIEK